MLFKFFHFWMEMFLTYPSYVVYASQLILYAKVFSNVYIFEAIL